MADNASLNGEVINIDKTDVDKGYVVEIDAGAEKHKDGGDNDDSSQSDNNSSSQTQDNNGTSDPAVTDNQQNISLPDNRDSS